MVAASEVVSAPLVDTVTGFLANGERSSYLDFGAHAIVSPGDDMVYLTPAWPNFAAAAELSGANPIAVPLAFAGGRWQIVHEHFSMPGDMESGKLLFEMRGHKLRGTWTLIKIKKAEKEWLLIKERDDFAAQAVHTRHFESILPDLQAAIDEASVQPVPWPSTVNRSWVNSVLSGPSSRRSMIQARARFCSPEPDAGSAPVPTRAARRGGCRTPTGSPHRP